MTRGYLPIGAGSGAGAWRQRHLLASVGASLKARLPPGQVGAQLQARAQRVAQVKLDALFEDQVVRDIVGSVGAPRVAAPAGQDDDMAAAAAQAEAELAAKKAAEIKKASDEAAALKKVAAEAAALKKVAAEAAALKKAAESTAGPAAAAKT